MRMYRAMQVLMFAATGIMVLSANATEHTSAVVVRCCAAVVFAVLIVWTEVFIRAEERK